MTERTNSATEKPYEKDLHILEMQELSHAPDILYHYTDVIATIGIVQTKEIWFSNIEFMNDFSEFEAGRDLFLRILTEKQGEFKTLSTFNRLLRFINNEVAQKDIFAFSLSEARDSLEQWRAYAHHESGVMISFSNVFCDLNDQGVHLLKIIYDDESYKLMIVEIIECMKNWDLTSEPTSMSKFLGALHDYLVRLFLSKKAQIYNAEREWKLIYTHRKIDEMQCDELDVVQSKIRFRLKSDFTLPYSVLCLNKVSPRRSTKSVDHSDDFHEETIREILLSPVNKNRFNDKKRNRSQMGLERLLESNGIESPVGKVQVSNLPYR